MKRSTLFSILAHISILGVLIFFGTREFGKSNSEPEVVAPSEIIDEAEFEARVGEAETVAAVEPSVANPEQYVDDIEILKAKIAEEMKRREEANRFQSEAPVETEIIREFRDPPQVAQTSQAPAPQVVASVPPIGELAPRSAVAPVSRPQNLNVATAPSNLASAASTRTDEIATLIENNQNFNPSENVSASAPSLPPVRGADPVQAPSEAVVSEVAADVKPVAVATASLAPSAVTLPPTRVSGGLNTAIDQLVQQVVAAEPEAPSNSEDSVKLANAEIEQLAAAVATEPTSSAKLAPSSAILPPARP